MASGSGSDLDLPTISVPGRTASGDLPTYLSPEDPIPVSNQQVIGSVFNPDDVEDEPVNPIASQLWGEPAKKPGEGVRSKALPFLAAPQVLDGSLPGDNGFDPLGLAGDQETLLRYRAAEIKHARLAMLAAAGWPLAETFNPLLSRLLGMPSITDPMGGRVPSVLNGGLDQVSLAYWFAALTFGAAVEVYGFTLRDKAPGDLNFDPLQIYAGLDDQAKRDMADKELANGRLAMVAIVGFAVQEFLTKIPVTDETPLFFKPAFLVFQQY